MTQQEATKVRLKVSPQVARIVDPGAPRDVRMSAARGALPLAGKELVTVLFFLCNSGDSEIRRTAIQTLKDLPETVLLAVLGDPALHPQLIDLVARARLGSHELMGKVITHPATREDTLLHMARKGEMPVLLRLEGHQARLEQCPAVVAAILANPNADRALKYRLGWEEQRVTDAPETQADGALGDDADEEVDVAALMASAEKDGESKYQIAMDLRVADKIKIAFTGDKEWRNILIKDANKLVQGAVLKNPRITDGEVLMVAMNKTSSDELIRLILLNKEWLKNYEIKRALCSHPKTPVPKAIRYISMLTQKDLKDLARSKQVSNILSTTARKELERRQKRGGG